MGYSCNPCDCPDQYYRDPVAWQKAVLVILCQIAAELTAMNTKLDTIAQNTEPA